MNSNYDAVPEPKYSQQSSLWYPVEVFSDHGKMYTDVRQGLFRSQLDYWRHTGKRPMWWLSHPDLETCRYDIDDKFFFPCDLGRNYFRVKPILHLSAEGLEE